VLIIATFGTTEQPHMKKTLTKFTASALLIAASCTLGFAQNSVKVTTNANAEVTFAKKLGTTPPIRQLIPMAPMSEEKRLERKKNRKVPANFVGKRGQFVSENPNALPSGPDPIRQEAILRGGGGLAVDPIVNIEGMDVGSPADPTGDVGQDYYMQSVNASDIAVYTKTGTLVQQFAANTIWNSIGQSSAGDPIILYDQEEDRWIMTEFPNGNALLVGISTTSDPMGTWDAYSFGTPSFPDYPKYGVWSNAYTVTTNEGGPGTSPCYFINRAELLAGAATVSIQRIGLPGVASGPGFQVDAPLDWSGLTAPPASMGPTVLSLVDDAWGGGLSDQVDIYTFDIDWNTPGNSSYTTESVFPSAFDTNPCSVAGFGFSCVPQAGNGGGLDAIPETIMNQAHYRNFGSHESMVFNFITDADGNNLSGIRWIELRRVGAGTWSVYQEGTFAPADGLDRYMAGICMDGNGNIAMAYNASSESEFVSMRFTGRLASDPLGTMTVPENTVAAGTNTINSGSRFGDYGHMSIDPTNDRTFWYTGEYGGGGGSSSTTRIISFEFGQDSIDMGATSLVTPVSAPGLSATETVEVEVKNHGLLTQTSFNVGYIFEGGAPVIDLVNTTLNAGEFYQHTFTPPVDMSTIGDYEFKVFTDLAGDQAILNDTLTIIVTHQATDDASVSNITGFGAVNCGETLDIDVELTNMGAVALTSATVIVELNGGTFETINWTGNLAPGASEDISVTLTGLINGNNTVIATSSLPNGNVDVINANDSFDVAFNVTTNGTDYTLEILTDDYPGETTWTLTLNGSTLYSGGPYNDANTLLTQTFCLDSGQCYIFTIDDAYGDGICCGYGDGYYTISDDEGNEIAGGGDFGDQDVQEFCVGITPCNLTADINIDNESGPGSADGVILITASNGTPPYMYSIDGGSTFETSGMFSGLSVGFYSIEVTDANGCVYTESVSIAVIDAIDELGEGSIKVYPNPTDGLFTIEISGLEREDVFLNLQILDATGRRIQSSNLTYYSGVYKGMLSLTAYSSGVYYVRLMDKNIDELIRVVRE
jgi:hypothetical protein